MMYFSVLLLLFMDGFGGETLWAQKADRGKELFEEVDRRRNALRFEESTLEMTIVSPRGQQRQRVLKSWSDTQGDDLKTMIRFDAPADVRGTSLLTIREQGAESQRIYLPAVGRVQLITGGQKKDRFMGSDFTYEDLGFQSPDEYSFSIQYENVEEVVIKAVKKETSAYAYILFYIHLERYVLLKAEYFKNDDAPAKRLIADDFVQVGDDNWRANTLTMYDLAEKRHTEIRWKNRTFPATISADVFTERYLRRGVQ